LPIYLLNSFVDDFSLLIVDEFLELNGVANEEVKYMKNQLLDVLENLHRVYGFDPEVISCSTFMKSEDYLRIFRDVKEQVFESEELSSRLLETVPEDKRSIPSAKDYPIHELACVKFLSSSGFSLKLGPTKEKKYDEVMQDLEFDIDFGYILDAYAIGTKHPDKVVHYIPSSRGPNHGQRLFFGMSEREVKTRIQQGGDYAMQYLCQIASVSGHILGDNPPTLEEVKELYGRRLKKKAINLVIESIIKPYNAVVRR
jgi:hypothetical protein